MGAGQASDRIEQDDHVASAFDQRLAFSSTMSRRGYARRRFVEGAGDDLRVRPVTEPIHVGHFFRPLVDEQNDDVASGWFLMMARAIFWSSTVLPARGGETIRPRWPLPIGVTRSTTRVGQFVGRGFEDEAGVGMQRRQVFEDGCRRFFRPANGR